jgi:hypothetical protein
MRVFQIYRYICFGIYLKHAYSSFDGEGTFYGDGGAGEHGACMLKRGFNGVATTVAINKPQYADGQACGKCVLISGKGVGSGQTPIIGPMLATIDNECPECAFGDIDLGLGGDGRWKISWDFVECPSQNNKRYLRHTV